MSESLRNERLAIHGGEPVRRERMPPRRALGDEEVRMIQEVISYYRENDVDPGYQGPFENLYTDAFVAMMGGGYADAVATGTSSLFIALAALDLRSAGFRRSPIRDRSARSSSTASSRGCVTANRTATISGLPRCANGLALVSPRYFSCMPPARPPRPTRSSPKRMRAAFGPSKTAVNLTAPRSPAGRSAHLAISPPSRRCTAKRI